LPISLRAFELFGFDSHTKNEWQGLMCSDLARFGNDNAGDDAEEYLGESEPTPSDSGAECGIHESEDRVKKASPE
jgi:hypothetical protein